MRKDHIIFLVFVLGFILSGCRYSTQVKETIDTSSLPVERVQASYAINVNDPREMVGYFDYVFVGEIEETEDTRYYHLMDSDTEIPEDWDATDCLEFTTYRVKVLENIKGELCQTEPISLKKRGGVLKDKTAIFVYEGDYLPKQRDICLFFANVSDGEKLVALGKNSTIFLQENTLETFGMENESKESTSYKSSAAYQDYIEAAKDPVVYDREPIMSQYDVNNQ